MNQRILFYLVAAAGLAVPLWTLAGFMNRSGQVLGLAVVSLMTALFVWGIVRLLQEQGQLSRLEDACQRLNAQSDGAGLHPDGWLAQVPGAYAESIRIRLQGWPLGLPALAPTAFLGGLLVMMGLAGTFAGLILTVDRTAEVMAAMQQARVPGGDLAGPLQGIGLAFGTSIAGISAAAALGLLGQFQAQRRRRSAHLLDGTLQQQFAAYSTSGRAERQLELLEAQHHFWPGALREQASHFERLGETLREQQAAFHAQIQTIQQENTQKLEVAAAALSEQLQSQWKQALQGLEQHLQALSVQTLERSQGALATATKSLQAEISRGTTSFYQKLSNEFMNSHEVLTEALKNRNEAAESQRQQQMAEVFQHLQDWAAGLNRLQEQLIQSSQALAQRAESDSISGSHLQALAERQQAQAAAWQTTLAERFSQLETHVETIGFSAAELGSLNEGFAAAVTAHCDSSQALLTGLQTLGEQFENSSQRSDEQFTATLQQAREVVDQCLDSQREVMQEVQKLQDRLLPELSS